MFMMNTSGVGFNEGSPDRRRVEGKAMLVLRRKTNESVVLNNVIKVTVLSVEGDRVKIGISAPPDVIVVREELLDEHRYTQEVRNPAPQYEKPVFHAEKNEPRY
jgi:carbon storage regulator